MRAYLAQMRPRIADAINEQPHISRGRRDVHIHFFPV